MNMGDMNKMMKQVQKMQQDMERVQAELSELEVEGSAGGGVVRVVCTAKQEMRRITIDPSAVDPDDVEMLQDLVLAAVNEALKKAQDRASEAVAAVTGGLRLPGMPF